MRETWNIIVQLCLVTNNPYVVFKVGDHVSVNILCVSKQNFHMFTAPVSHPTHIVGVQLAFQEALHNHQRSHSRGVEHVYVIFGKTSSKVVHFS